MNSVVKASLVLAGLVALFSSAYYLVGLHENFMVGQMVFLAGAIGLNVGVVVWALGQSADEKPYAGQLTKALGIGVLGGVLVTAVSWLLLAVIFPDVLAEMRTGAIVYMDAAEMPRDQYDRQLATLEAATPMSQSIPGGVGTFFTSLVSGAVVAIFKRRK